MSRPFILAEANWSTVQQTAYDTAVITWGATEAHNYHLPYGTDNYQASYVAERAVERAWFKGAKVVLLPGIPFGVNTGQADINLCINMMPSTQLTILKDICSVLVLHKVGKLVIINGHGANQFVAMIRELAGLFPQLFISVVNWYQSAPKDDIFEHPGDHADEMETMDTAGDGATKSFKLDGFKQGWAWTQRPWSKITKDTGSGDPSKATLQKGEIFLNRTIENIGNFLYDLSQQSIDELLH
ncbi:MAG: creatininase family protein [Sphingobacteriales bacterium]|nr:MAG: creatininase family protein [Sphingobacteriales bacterium]